MAMNARDKLMKAIRAEFGDDCIIVYKDEYAGYYIGSSSLRPSAWREILLGLVKRL